MQHQFDPATQDWRDTPPPQCILADESVSAPPPCTRHRVRVGHGAGDVDEWWIMGYVRLRFGHGAELACEDLLDLNDMALLQRETIQRVQSDRRLTGLPQVQA